MRRIRIKEDILDRLPREFRSHFTSVEEALLPYLKEIRLRVGQPVLLSTGKGDFTLNWRPKTEEVTNVLESLCKNSMYAYGESLKEGYVTVEGGHRIGVAGRYIEGRGICNVGSLNIRLAGEIKGCGDEVLPYLRRGRKDIYNTLVLSPPCCGKTTLLRDLARCLSVEGFTVGVVDERSEIGGCYMGVPTNDLGPRCDVYDGCPKSLGISMMLRAMAPDVIITDEIGNGEDAQALRQASWAGIRLIASCHGYGEQDVACSGLTDIFQKAVVLSSRKGPGTVEKIIRIGGGI